jgi:hypothetical protein
MSLEWQARSNPVAWWWGLLALISCVNIALWLSLYHGFHSDLIGSMRGSSTELMLLLSAAYVFGCAFRSFLPRADVQRICLFDSWLSSVLVGRSVATVAELSFAAQWALLLSKLGGMAGADTALNVSWMIVPLIFVAQCCSWYGVLTTNYLANAIENSIWAAVFFMIGVVLCRLLPEFSGPVWFALVIAIVGIAAYLTFLVMIDVPMYLRRWQAGIANGNTSLGLLEGIRDAGSRWVVTHDLAQWREEIPWMSLYFSAAVWGSLALCVVYALDLAQFRG